MVFAHQEERRHPRSSQSEAQPAKPARPDPQAIGSLFLSALSVAKHGYCQEAGLLCQQSPRGFNLSGRGRIGVVDVLTEETGFDVTHDVEVREWKGKRLLRPRRIEVTLRPTNTHPSRGEGQLFLSVSVARCVRHIADRQVSEAKQEAVGYGDGV